MKTTTTTTADKLNDLFKGQWVIIRSQNEGINFGKFEYADEHTVVITEARRLWFFSPKDKNESWFEGVANSGLNASSKLSGATKMKCVTEAYSMTVCRDEAAEAIKAFPSHKQE